MAEHTPGYAAALSATLHQANVDVLRAAEHGENQLGAAVTKHPGLRLWNGCLLRFGHHPLTPFAADGAVPITIAPWRPLDNDQEPDHG